MRLRSVSTAIKRWLFPRAGSSGASLFSEDFFQREDESPDEHFYEVPRFVRHIDDDACEALKKFYDRLLPDNAAILDLMSSWVSHLPEDRKWSMVSGLGMNEEELRNNAVLTDFQVGNLNTHPELPYADQTFDACLIAVSVQYLTQPVAIFREIARVLVPEGACCVSFSNRLFPTKATRAWRTSGDAGHVRLVKSYFAEAQRFEKTEFKDISPYPGRTDPLYVVVARVKTRPQERVKALPLH